MSETSIFLVKNGENKILDQVWTFDKSGQKKEIVIKAVVEDGGNIAFKGRLKIEKNVEDVEAFLKYKVLLVGETARATVMPELEIESNEVRASHAASIGRVDEEQIFYLQSRGMNREEAVRLIIKAFLNE